MSRNSVSCMVKLSPSSGLDLNAYLVLKQKPTRQEQKLKTLLKYVRKYSSGWKKRLELANLLYETGKWSEAIPEYYQVIKGQPQLIQPRIQLGKILQLMKREQEAIAVYQSAIDVAQKAATKQHLLGLVKSCEGNNQEAIASFKSATTLEPKNLVHWMALGQIQMREEQFKAALSSFAAILSLAPDNFMALIYSHDLLLTLGNLDQAEQCLAQATEIAPQDIQTLKRLIANRHRKKLVSDAEGKKTKKLINSLLKQASSSPEAHHLLAQYFILRGEQEKGVKVLKQLTEEYSQNPHTWYYYSRCLFTLGKREAAVQAILQAHKLSGDNPEINRALCKIRGCVKKLRSCD